METKPVTHTAGPWYVDAEPWLGIEYGYWLDVGPAKLFIDWHSTSYKGKLELESVQFNMADARLIAAAPELLEALQRLLDCTELNMDDEEPETQAAVKEACSVIAKATGGVA